MKKILLGFIAIGLFTFVGCGTSSSVEYGEGVTDFKGNTYKSVKIGKQEWMAENLNVNHFQNGEIIPEAKTEEEWAKARVENRPVWCFYDNDISNGGKYCKLYNWYAVNDPRGLAPKGWHVPTNFEWTVLTDYLAANGHSGAEGKALKSTSGWNNSGNGTDNYGWLGLPGGNRYDYGNFHDIGVFGYWWSSSERDPSNAWTRTLEYGTGRLSRNYGHKKNGFSVRCLRD